MGLASTRKLMANPVVAQYRYNLKHRAPLYSICYDIC